MIIHLRYPMAILAILTLGYAPSSAQVANPDLIAQAKKEGRVAWYTTVAIPEAKQLIDMFEKQYPFIKVDLPPPAPVTLNSASSA